MNKKETEILIARIEKWYAQLPNNVVYDKIPFQAKFGWSKEKVLFKDRLTLDYKPIKEGDEWGSKWESAWFHLTADIPSDLCVSTGIPRPLSVIVTVPSAFKQTSIKSQNPAKASSIELSTNSKTM